MSMRIHLNHYHLNMTLCRRLSCCSIHSYRHDRKVVIKHCSISSGIFEYIPKYAVLSHQYWQDTFHVPCLWCSLKGSSLGLQDQATGWPGDVPKTRKQSACKHCIEDLHGNICCVSNAPPCEADETVTHFTEMFPTWLCSDVQSKLVYAPPHSQRNRDQ